MRKLILAYIRFLFKSTNQHGVHSPFVYDLVTKCFYDKTKYAEYEKLGTYRRSLLKNTDLIAVTDLGVGSQVMRTNDRKVSDMAKNAGTTPTRAKLLYRLMKYLNIEKTLELGTSMGIGTYTMCLANPDGTVTSIEGCPNISNFSGRFLQNQGVKNFDLLIGDFGQILKTLDHDYFDLIFIDGNHDMQATIDYFNTLLPKTHNDTVMIFDDINWSNGMRDAWAHIANHSKVTVSIDTFFWGIAFFRKEQEKEHFIIRI